MKVLVCGGRDFQDASQMECVLSRLHRHTPISVLIAGGARGADRLAEQWAHQSGVLLRVFPADWHTHGKSAGPIRNRQMLTDGLPDLVVAFPGGRGTQNMIEQARKANVPTIVINTHTNITEFRDGKITNLFLEEPLDET